MQALTRAADRGVKGAHLSRRHPACRARANEGLSGACRDAGRRDKDQAQVRRADALKSYQIDGRLLSVMAPAKREMD